MSVRQTSSTLFVALLFASPVVLSAEPTSMLRQRASTLAVEVLDQETNSKIQSLRIKLHAAQAVHQQYKNPFVATARSQDSCALQVLFGATMNYVVECEFRSPGSGARIEVHGDCERNDSDHPTLVNYTALRDGGPVWLIATWCVVE